MCNLTTNYTIITYTIVVYFRLQSLPRHRIHSCTWRFPWSWRNRTPSKGSLRDETRSKTFLRLHRQRLNANRIAHMPEWSLSFSIHVSGFCVFSFAVCRRCVDLRRSQGNSPTTKTYNVNLKTPKISWASISPIPNLVNLHCPWPSPPRCETS